MYTKPLLTYQGSKYKLLPQIIPLLPKKINTYVEMFCGSMAVGLNVNAETYVFNDLQYPLIKLYQDIKNNTVNLEKLEHLVAEYELSMQNKQGYMSLRDEYNLTKDSNLLLILLHYAFGNKIRFNNNGMFNNAFGGRSAFTQNSIKKLAKFKKFIQRDSVIFSSINFDSVDIEMLSRGDFVYLDPPYSIVAESYQVWNINTLNKKCWSDADDDALHKVLRTLTLNGVKFAMSNVSSYRGVINKKLNILKEDFGSRLYITNLKYNYKNSYRLMSSLESQEVLVTNYNPDESND